MCKLCCFVWLFFALRFSFSVFEAYENLKDNKRIPKTQWELEVGYKEGTRRYELDYPYRAAGSGENGGVKFDILRNSSEVKNSPNVNKGFKLVVHLPCDIPQFDKQYFRFPLEKSATLIVRPTFMDTDEDVDYVPQKRQCYFEGEKKLQLFKMYTRSNCQIECLAEFTRQKCKCIHYSMPRLKGDHVCDNSSLSCYVKAKKDLMLLSMKQGVNAQIKENKDLAQTVCGCLPACTSLSYEGEISHDDIRYFKKHKNYE